MTEPSAEAFGLLVSDIADVEGGILKSPLEVRSAPGRTSYALIGVTVFWFAARRAPA